MKKQRSTEIKVGIFVTVTIGLLMFVIVTLSSRSNLFRSTYNLHTSFENVMGLTEGAEVRLSGVDIGLVKSIKFSGVEGQTEVFVDMSIIEQGMERIPKDSVCTIETLGVLGKKYIEIVPGDPESGFVEEDDSLEGTTPKPLTAALDEIGGTIDEARKVFANLETITASIRGGDDAPETDLAKAISGLEDTIDEVKQGSGVLHALIYDPTKTQIINDLAASVRTVKQVTHDIKHGDGTLHAVIYSEKGEQMITNITDATGDIKHMVSTVKSEPGALHSLIYDPEKAQIIDDLKVTVANLRLASEKIARGEGSLGALIIDPTIYDDVKKITGGLERSQVFKSVLRNVIQKYESDSDKQPEE